MNTAHRQASQAKRHSGRGQYSADPMALFRVLNKLQPFSAAEQVQLSIPPRVCFEALRTGRGTESDFHTLAAIVNVSLIMSETIDPLCIETCIKAQAALMRCLARFNTVRKWGLDGPALQDIEPVIDFHEQLLTLCTPHQLQEAMRTTLERMANGDVLEGELPE